MGIRTIYPLLLLLALAPLLGGAKGQGCSVEESGTDIQRDRQNRVTKEGAMAVGVPAIVNFREMRQLKDIYELRDQDGLITYTYTYSEVTGKPTFFCDELDRLRHPVRDPVHRWRDHAALFLAEHR